MWRVPVLLWAAAVVPSLFIVDKVGGPTSAVAFMLVSPVVLHQVLTGTVHLSNAVSVLLGLRWWRSPWCLASFRLAHVA